MIDSMVDYHVRWMIRRDMPEVLRIEQKCYTGPWSEEDFLRCLRQRNCIGVVVEEKEKVLGFMLYELHPSRLHIINIAVDPTHWREQIGATMINKLKSKLATHRRTEITADVRESNLRAQLFYRSKKFLAQEVVRDHFEDTGEAAYRMSYNLPK